ncbi:MAG: M48 family metallopeptidase [Pseudomonadota bacterium]
MRILALLLLAAGLSGCVATAPTPTASVVGRADPSALGAVVARVEPVAERECRARVQGVNCDFTIFVESDPRAGVNAFQTVDPGGRPVIIVTTGLLEAVINDDELAFVIGHEAAHHIRQHIPQQVDAARRGALVFGVLAQMGGADEAGIREAAEVGATVGARRFSQEHELEADQLGTVIAARAGFDPVRGAAFFQRLPDPGNRIFSTHPPNAQRQAVVRQTAASL